MLEEELLSVENAIFCLNNSYLKKTVKDIVFQVAFFTSNII